MLQGGRIVGQVNFPGHFNIHDPLALAFPQGAGKSANTTAKINNSPNPIPRRFGQMRMVPPRKEARS